jgi:hypothetical protein
MLQVRNKVLGVLPFSSPMWNMAIAAGISAFVGVALRPIITSGWVVVPVALAMILVYYAASIMLGIGDDERRVARSFLKPASATTV